jgi:hypothetical protein
MYYAQAITIGVPLPLSTLPCAVLNVIDPNAAKLPGVRFMPLTVILPVPVFCTSTLCEVTAPSTHSPSSLNLLYQNWKVFPVVYEPLITSGGSGGPALHDGYTSLFNVNPPDVWWPPTTGEPK